MFTLLSKDPFHIVSKFPVLSVLKKIFVEFLLYMSMAAILIKRAEPIEQILNIFCVAHIQHSFHSSKIRRRPKTLGFT